MKILMISSYLPYPLFSGGQVRLYNLIKKLSAKHEITLICEKRSHQTEKDISEVKKICKEVITVERKRQWSLSNITKAVLSSNSFLLTGHTNSILQQKIQEILVKNTFDVIHVETYYVMQNLLESGIRNQESGKIPIVLVEHNIEYKVYAKFMNRAPSLIRPLLQLDILKIRKEEEHFWRKAKALIAVSREDQVVMKKAGIDSFLVSNGVNTSQFVYKEKSNELLRTKKILFLGDFKWIQNQDSVKFILKEIWPKIREKGLGTRDQKNDIKLWIVGRKIPDSVRSLTNDSDVLFDEESSSLSTEKIFQEASVLLSPIRVGGGTSYKILEAMSTGTPVVTMQMSADALGAKDRENIMIGKTAEELARKTINLLSDQSLYKTISKNGRTLIENDYTWKKIGKKLDEVYKSVTSNK